MSPTGLVRVVDYKTGRAPWELSESKALFQMKFYALVLLRTRGVVPARLQLLYLGDGQALTYDPVEDELLRFERTLSAIWQAISEAGTTGTSAPIRADCVTGATIGLVARPSVEHRPRIRVGRTSLRRGVRSSRR